MDGGESPKKTVNRTKYYCRICKSSFNIKYGTGKSGRISTEKLYRESNRNGSRCEISASMCEDIGMIFMKSPNLSERACNPCAGKIRNLWKVLSEILLGIPENNLKLIMSRKRNLNCLVRVARTPIHRLEPT